MDVKEWLEKEGFVLNEKIILSGWIVDLSGGLYILGNHYPECYDYPYKVKICNSNIIYRIFEKITTLAGGKSLFFHKAKVVGLVKDKCNIEVVELSVQPDRNFEGFQEIDLDIKKLDSDVEKLGVYVFDRPLNQNRDWLDDVKLSHLSNAQNSKTEKS